MSDWFATRYGTRKGFAALKWSQLQYLLGSYARFHVPWDEIDRLVFICKGNICRSAFAEAVAKRSGIDAISAGLHTVLGAPADKIAIRVARDMGYDLSVHRTMPVMYLMLRKTDLVVAMEPWQAELASRNLSLPYPTTLLGLWAKPIRPFIADPFGCSPTYFQNCFRYIESSVHAIAKKAQKSC